jgi:hypothetical protein
MRDDRQSRGPIYRIDVTGRPNPRWADWFGGMQIVTGGTESSPVTVLAAPAPDQPALRGLLTRMWDLNLTVGFRPAATARVTRVPGW